MKSEKVAKGVSEEGERKEAERRVDRESNEEKKEKEEMEEVKMESTSSCGSGLGRVGVELDEGETKRRRLQ